MNWIERFLAAIATHKADVNAHHALTHGAAQHTNVTRELFLPWSSGRVEGGTPDSAGLEGAVGADEPEAVFWMKVPTDFVSFTSVKAIWTSSGAAGNMHWALLAFYSACGEDASTHTEEPAFGATATGGADIRNCQEPANPLTLASLALGDVIKLGFSREGTHMEDTLDDVMWFEGLLFTYVGHQ